jgi:hypothetical protein
MRSGPVVSLRVLAEGSQVDTRTTLFPPSGNVTLSLALGRLKRIEALDLGLGGKVFAGPEIAVGHDTDKEREGVEAEDVDFIGSEVATESA